MICQESLVAFEKLLDIPPACIPMVGDRVVVAVGLLGYGFHWVRKEGKVLEVGDTSYKVRFEKLDYKGGPVELWSHWSLITDVLHEEQAVDPINKEQTENYCDGFNAGTAHAFRVVDRRKEWVRFVSAMLSGGLSWSDAARDTNFVLAAADEQFRK